jgi:hypothetical protein
VKITNRSNIAQGSGFLRDGAKKKSAPGKNFSKISLSYAILIGRLEFFPLTLS